MPFSEPFRLHASDGEGRVAHGAIDPIKLSIGATQKQVESMSAA